MSFQVPRNVPSFSSAQQPYEDGHWRAAHRGGQNGSIGSKISDFMKEGNDLPMYKDKPNLPSNRRRGIFQRKRTFIITALVFLLFFWYYGPVKKASTQTQPQDKSSTFAAGDIWKYVDKASPKKAKAADWESRRESVRDAFLISWEGYEKYAWGLDEYHPISKGGRHMVENGLGWIIVDALDTAMIMNLTSCVKHARDWISTSLRYDASHEVNTFETTIRMLGGLLSAHYLSTTFPNLAPLTEDDVTQPGEDLYIEKATDLADRILGAFESPSGIPYASFNLNTSTGIPSHADSGASSTAEAATTQLELKYLAKLTGEPHYWYKAERVMEVIDSNHMEGGLLPIYVYPATGGFRGENIRLGSRGDSYYEYLIKQYHQTSYGEPIYLDMWNEALAGVKQHLITYTKDSQLTVLAERPSGLSKGLSPKMDHLVCFMPGTIALAVTGGRTVAQAKKDGKWTMEDEENMVLAKELMKTCWATYRKTKTGLAPEITFFVTDDPPKMYNDFSTSTRPVSKPLDESESASWRSDLEIHSNDVHNLQRPETVESLFYMYRITGDEMYREWGWDMFKSFVKYTSYPPPDVAEKSEIYAFTSLDTINTNDPDNEPPPRRDNMESFWLAETLKYFYLLFSPDDLLPLDQVVINTEAHFFPRFDMGKNFKTGWKRGEKRDLSETHDAPAPVATKVVKVEVEEAKPAIDQTASAPPAEDNAALSQAIRDEAMRQVGKTVHNLETSDEQPAANQIHTPSGGDHYSLDVSPEEAALNEAIRAEAMRQVGKGPKAADTKGGKAEEQAPVKKLDLSGSMLKEPSAEEAALNEAIRAEAMRQARKMKEGGH